MTQETDFGDPELSHTAVGSECRIFIIQPGKHVPFLKDWEVRLFSNCLFWGLLRETCGMFTLLHSQSEPMCVLLVLVRLCCCSPLARCSPFNSVTPFSN